MHLSICLARPRQPYDHYLVADQALLPHVTDVHLSKDGRILCTHDASLDRGTTGTGLIR